VKKFFPILATLLVFGLLCGGISALAASAEQGGGDTVILYPDKEEVLINGLTGTLDVAPYINNGVTMVPLRFLAENILDAKVGWEEQSGRVSISTWLHQLVINTKTGHILIDGQLLPSTYPVEIKSYRTFLPLRVISELFDCQVGYDASTKAISVITPVWTLTKPVAKMNMPASFVAGQKISYTDQSYDINGLDITERRWEIIDAAGSKREESSLSSFIYSLSPGSYELCYLVKNTAGLWSEPQILPLTIKANIAPEIVSFRTDNSRVDIGEPVNFNYSYQNEDWEDVVQEEWSYEYPLGKESKTSMRKPSAFFAAGNYKVGLRLLDAYGNWSETKYVTIKVTSNVENSEAQYKFTNLQPGEMYLNQKTFNFNTLKTLEPYVAQNGPNLLASNNPETVIEKGILYSDYLTGAVRIRYHHCNGSDNNLQIMALAINNSGEPVTLKIGRFALAGPSEGAMQVGMQVVKNFLLSQDLNTTVIVPAGGVYVVSQSLLKPGQNGSTLVDVNAIAGLTFMVVALGEDNRPEDYKYLTPLGTYGSHIRGTFKDADFQLTYDYDGSGGQKIILGRDDAFDGYFLDGYDYLSNVAILDKGDRGVWHSMLINNNSDKKVGIIANPRGLIFRGAILLNGEDMVDISSAGLFKGSNEGAVIGVIEAGASLKLDYLPPSGSDTPLLLVLLPEGVWSKY